MRQVSACKPAGGNASILDRRSLQSCSPPPPQAWREEPVPCTGPALHYYCIREKIRHMFRVSLFIHGRQILIDCRAAFLFGISFVIFILHRRPRVNTFRFTHNLSFVRHIIHVHFVTRPARLRHIHESCTRTWFGASLEDISLLWWISSDFRSALYFLFFLDRYQF